MELMELLPDRMSSEFMAVSGIKVPMQGPGQQNSSVSITTKMWGFIKAQKYYSSSIIRLVPASPASARHNIEIMTYLRL